MSSIKVGDLVKHSASDKPGLVVEMTQKKVWRTHLHGRKVQWDKIEPEPHAAVLWAHNSGPAEIPLQDLEVVNEIS